MKHGKKPTVNQCKFIKSHGLVPENWLVVKDTPDIMLIVHRHRENNMKTIHKEKRSWI